ncbi:MAG: efflux RND transporter periplasmic adaptor subunit [bacterium JZ-2024 1]
MTGKGRFFIGVLCLVVLSLSFSFCRAKAKESEKDDSRKTERALAVDVAPAREQLVEKTVHFVGSFAPEKVVVASSEVDGKIVEIYADVGDRVRAGQVLARLEDEEYRLMVKQAEGQVKSTLSRLGLNEMPQGGIIVEETPNARRAKAQLEQAQADYERIKTLYEQGAVARADLERVETALKTAEETYKNVLDETRALVNLLQAQNAQLDLARKKLEETTIKSPLNGVVTKRMVEKGQYVSARMGGAPVMEISSVSPIKLIGSVPERFLPDVKTGLPVRVQVQSLPDRIFHGKISRISPEINPLNRSAQVESLFANDDFAIKPGTFAEGEIIISTRGKAVVVPINAVVSFGGIHKVFVIHQGKAIMREIKKGRTLADGIEVVEGVQAGELVAVSGVNSLYDGAPVHIREKAGEGE